MEKKCEYLEINLCNGKKKLLITKCLFPLATAGFLRPGLLCFILTERCYWCFWFGSDGGEAFGKCSTELTSGSLLRVLLYFSIMLCSTGTVFIFLSWMKLQMFPSFSDCSERCKQLCLITVDHLKHTDYSQHPVFNYIHIRSLLSSRRAIFEMRIALCSDSINDTF